MILSAISLSKNKGSNSHEIRMMMEESTKVGIKLSPNIDPKNMMLNTINAVLTILFPIKEVKKRFSGLLIKNRALFAAALFFCKAIFILILLAVIKTVSETAKKALTIIDARSRKKIKVMKIRN
jgi:hypothetical protein